MSAALQIRFAFGFWTGWGYAHDRRADKYPYPQDRRADKDSLTGKQYNGHVS